MTPTTELTIQIWEQGTKFKNGLNIKCGIAYGGTIVGFQLQNLVGIPGRLLNFDERGYISLEDLQYFVLDKANWMLEMVFRMEIDKFMTNPNMPAKSARNTLMFSATFARLKQLNI